MRNKDDEFVWHNSQPLWRIDSFYYHLTCLIFAQQTVQEHLLLTFNWVRPRLSYDANKIIHMYVRWSCKKGGFDSSTHAISRRFHKKLMEPLLRYLEKIEGGFCCLFRGRSVVSGSYNACLLAEFASAGNMQIIPFSLSSSIHKFPSRKVVSSALDW